MDDVDLSLASGISAFEAKEFTNAMRLLSPLAELGIAEAQYRMGMMYQNGLGLVKNDDYALKMMTASADQGHAYAQHGLGIMYLYGESVEKNEQTALSWFTKAADQG